MDKRLENLKKRVPFKKGKDERRNVTGLNRKDQFDKDFDVAIEGQWIPIIEAQIKEAKKGNSQAAKLLIETGIGKPNQQIALTGKDGGTIDININDITSKFFRPLKKDT